MSLFDDLLTTTPTPPQPQRSYTTNIEAISRRDVLEYDKIKYNVNNLWKIKNTPPADYHHIISAGQTHHWIDIFHRSYHVINIHHTHLQWMKRAYGISNTTAEWSRMFDDELELLLNQYEDISERIFPDEKQQYFVRSESVSLKFGMYGAGPYTSLEHIIKSCVTCTEGHQPFDKDATRLKLYLLPWQNIHYDVEFRVFVYENKICAISQQHLYSVNQTLTSLTTEHERNNLINHWIDIIHQYHTSFITTHLTHFTSYTMDIAILDNDKPYFIEINSFGAEYGAGSSLFHWHTHHQQLHGMRKDQDGKDVIYFRWTCE